MLCSYNSREKLFSCGNIYITTVFILMIFPYYFGRVDYAVRSHTVDHSPSTHGRWHMEAFLSWLDYCEQVVGVAQPVLADALCESINEMLLRASLLPKLIKL